MVAFVGIFLLVIPTIGLLSALVINYFRGRYQNQSQTLK